ncbi:hypothetical protein [Haloarcula argentinensis]|uniref:Uncharacterized protein n=1 Tax=Haloarcula argentinensis TaxID=43776 RepID=A0A847UM02_HALAR|nr:hypothetical protein [Haloarcula argentinensis]NLV15095.1 hypothetical protein [Haloarcula argentinensis]
MRDALSCVLARFSRHSGQSGESEADETGDDGGGFAGLPSKTSIARGDCQRENDALFSP